MKKQNRKYLIIGVALVLLFVLSSCGGGNQTPIPIEGSIFKSSNLFVWPMAGLIFFIGKYLVGGSYAITIIISTIIVRTLAWPIYTKTNDMSLKMQLMAPEQAKLEAKYANKTDPESQQRKQMELMQLSKKYGLGLGGCLLPILQFPIFIGFYNTLQRIPYTLGSQFALDFTFMKTNFFGIDLFQKRIFEDGVRVSDTQHWGIIILAAIVGITQLIHQFVLNQRQKKIKDESQSNIPQYRQQQQTDVQKQSQNMMKIMMYGMSAMMVVFVYNSAAALGLYWVVGNIYSTLQGLVGSKMSKKRMEKLRDRI